MILSRMVLYVHVEDRVRRHRQPLITNANHEDTLTNVRSTRPAIMDGLHMVDVREYNSSADKNPNKGHPGSLIPPRYICGCHALDPTVAWICPASVPPFVEVIDICILLYYCGRSYSKTTCRVRQPICCPVHK